MRGGSCTHRNATYREERKFPGSAPTFLRPAMPGTGRAFPTGETTVLEAREGSTTMRVLFADVIFEKVFGRAGVSLEGHEVRTATPETLFDELPRAEAVILPPLVFGEKHLAAAPNLRLVQQWGVGVENIDLAACRRRNVPVCNVPSRGTGNGESVAEMVLLHLLLLSRRFAASQENLRKGRLHAPLGSTLWGKRACVVGLGNLGHCIVERLLCLGVTVAGVNRTLREEHAFWGMEQVFPLHALGEAVRGCHFIILAVPETAETRGLVNAEVLRAMESGAFLVNVSRGSVIVRKDLEETLRARRLGGVGLDVFWEEPPSPEDPLLSLPEVVATPHLGGVTREAHEGIARFVLENLNRVARGEEPLSRVTD